MMGDQFRLLLTTPYELLLVYLESNGDTPTREKIVTWDGASVSYARHKQCLKNWAKSLGIHRSLYDDNLIDEAYEEVMERLFKDEIEELAKKLLN